ncbi:MAG: hypothetical protein GY928_29735 [Colwellia sp.]|nr:hypothetical protein [Colwellia sp.]
MLIPVNKDWLIRTLECVIETRQSSGEYWAEGSGFVGSNSDLEEATRMLEKVEAWGFEGNGMVYLEESEASLLAEWV